MPDSRLPLLLTRLPDESARRSRRCPDEHRLAAYAECRLRGAERSRLEGHLADCGRCLSQVAFLARAPGPAEPPPVPASWVAAASGARRRRPALWSSLASTPIAAAAAAALVLLLAGPGVKLVERAAGSSPGGSSTFEGTRAAEPRAGAPALIAPREGAEVPRSGLELRWSAVPGARSYTVQLLSFEGDLLWEARAGGTRLAVPADLALSGGRRYYAWVEVELAGGGTRRSPATLFVLAGP